MPATMLIREKNGAGENATDKTSGTIRFRNSDAATVDNTNPLVVPTANTEYSFRKVLRMHISAGTFTEVSNPNFYLDGANTFGTGRKLWMNNTAQGTYTQGTVPTETNDPPQFPGVTPMIDAFGATVRRAQGHGRRQRWAVQQHGLAQGYRRLSQPGGRA